MIQTVDETGKYFSYDFEEVRYAIFPSGSFHCALPCAKHFHQILFVFFFFSYSKLLDVRLSMSGT